MCTEASASGGDTVLDKVRDELIFAAIGFVLTSIGAFVYRSYRARVAVQQFGVDARIALKLRLTMGDFKNADATRNLSFINAVRQGALTIWTSAHPERTYVSKMPRFESELRKAVVDMVREEKLVQSSGACCCRDAHIRPAACLDQDIQGHVSRRVYDIMAASFGAGQGQDADSTQQMQSVQLTVTDPSAPPPGVGSSTANLTVGEE